MKTYLVLALILSVAFISVGCQTASTAPTKTLTDSNAETYCGMGVMMADQTTASMASWAQTGVPSINGLADTITGPDTNGYYHMVTSESDGLGTYDVDLYIKLGTSGGKVTAVDVVGNYTYTITSQGTTLVYKQICGTGTYSVSGTGYTTYSGTVTWNATGTAVTKVTGLGSIKMDITSTAGGQTGEVALTYTLNNFSLTFDPLVADYPSGTITVGIVYNGAAQPDFVMTFDGTSTATWSYGGTSGNFTVFPASVD